MNQNRETLSEVLPITLSWTNHYAVRAVQTACPQCQASIGANEIAVQKKRLEKESGIELALHAVCSQCKHAFEITLRYLLDQNGLVQLRWDTQKAEWVRTAYAGGAPIVARQKYQLPFADRRMMIVACIVMAMLPPSYQSVPNDVGVFIFAWLAARAVTKYAKAR